MWRTARYLAPVVISIAAFAGSVQAGAQETREVQESQTGESLASSCPGSGVEGRLECLNQQIGRLRKLVSRSRSAQYFEFPTDPGSGGSAQTMLDYTGPDFWHAAVPSDTANAVARADVFCKTIGFEKGLPVETVSLGIQSNGPKAKRMHYRIRSLICHFGDYVPEITK